MPASNIPAQLAYQICPIILTGGIAAQVPGAMLPILSLMYPGGSALNLPYNINDLDDAFAAFNVVPGGQLILQQIGQYPFANQWVAANAVIREPLTISVIMDTPMRGTTPWAIKQQVFTSLQATLESHNNAGGTYTVATPAYIYTNLVMLALTDTSRAANSLPQNAWRFDFEQPLVSQQAANGIQNQQMSMITNGVVTTGTAGPTPATAAQPQSMQTFKIAGAMAGGPPALALTGPSPQNLNYPAIVPSAGLSFGGIS
jgi:hypothetical protein